MMHLRLCQGVCSLDLLQMVEWDMLLFFCGMFIMVEGAVELGLMRKIAALITFIIDTAPASGQKVGGDQLKG